MRNSVSVTSVRSAAMVFTAALAIFAVPAWAQRAPIRRVTMVTVKPDHITEFEAAVKEYNSVYARVPGVRALGLFQSQTGASQFVLVRDFDKWSDLDPSPVTKALQANADLVRANQRIAASIESQSSLVEELLPELSSATSPSEPPKLIRLARSRIQPAKTAEFEALVKKELFPAYVKAGSKSFTVRRVRFGGPTNDYYISTRMDNWADVDNSLQKAMGDAAYNAMVTKLTAVTLSREINIYRFPDELSYSPQRSTVAPVSSTR